ncbi:hypothetical protein PLEOSDRAFT_154202 [Pleurotus ostreatus PC15]|uniref:Uncharacterized protein n=1 Tax=Pleurotus ostreatus (strain PC15) TaxID=1137138 RepID=A0A067NYE2_PLEO1|nr:hypothetical protein PLEOSDRAFT_154202 [Pleurotus ostreatus PC15]
MKNSESSWRGTQVTVYTIYRRRRQQRQVQRHKHCVAARLVVQCTRKRELDSQSGNGEYRHVAICNNLRGRPQKVQRQAGASRLLDFYLDFDLYG